MAIPEYISPFSLGYSVWRVQHTREPLPVHANVPMCLGEPRRRRVHREAPSVVTLTRELSAAATQEWSAWWHATALQGVEEFEAVVGGLGANLQRVTLRAMKQPRLSPTDDGTFWEIQMEAVVTSIIETLPTDEGEVGESPSRVLSYLAMLETPPVDSVSGHEIVGLDGWNDVVQDRAALTTSVVIPGGVYSFENYGVAPESDLSYSSPILRSRSNANLDPIDAPLGTVGYTFEMFTYVPDSGGTLVDLGYETRVRFCDQNYVYYTMGLDINYDPVNGDWLEAWAGYPIENPTYSGETGYVGTPTLSPTLPLGSWLHSAITVGPQGLRLFLNGVKVAEEPTAGFSARGFRDISWVRLELNPEKREATRTMFQGPARVVSGILYTADFTPPTSIFV